MKQLILITAFITAIVFAVMAVQLIKELATVRPTIEKMLLNNTKVLE